MGHTRKKSTGIHLTTIVLIAITTVFATVLIAVTGELTTLWPLYVVPIVIAALSYHVPGAVLVSALSTALIAFMLYSVERDISALPELVVGMGAFTISGIVIGTQAYRSLRHREALEEASIHDPLTGLLKREHLDHRLNEEVRRAERYQFQTAVILVKVDCFDEFREQFGRYKADVMLEHLGEVLDVNTRDTDILGRFGTTSFGVILPYTDYEGATATAEHLEQAVAQTEFEGDVLEPATHCTVTTAVAVYPENGGTAVAILTVATERLGEDAG